MAADRLICVGCAMSRFSKPPTRVYQNYFVCNYSFNNILGSPVYVAGPTGSQCANGTNPFYAGLCNLNEKVNSNL